MEKTISLLFGHGEFSVILHILLIVAIIAITAHIEIRLVDVQKCIEIRATAVQINEMIARKLSEIHAE